MLGTKQPMPGFRAPLHKSPNKIYYNKKHKEQDIFVNKNVFYKHIELNIQLDLC